MASNVAEPVPEPEPEPEPVPGSQRPDDFDEDYDLSSGQTGKGVGQGARTLNEVAAAPRIGDPPRRKPPTPEETPAETQNELPPRTPLSAAMLEHFKAPETPSVRALEVQVLTEWTTISQWLCDSSDGADDKWSKVRQIVDSWAKTCVNLKTKRIGRIDIGLSAHTADVVLKPMYLSIHDVLDFFDFATGETNQWSELEAGFDRFAVEERKTLEIVEAEFGLLTTSYPENDPLKTIAGLIMQVHGTIRARVRELKKLVTQQNKVQCDLESLTAELPTTSEMCTVIDSWYRNCKRWNTMSTGLFAENVRQSCSRPQSKLQITAHQMLKVRQLLVDQLVEEANASLGEKQFGQLRFVVHVLEKRGEELGELAREVEFDLLVSGTKECVQRIDELHNSSGLGHEEPIDPLEKAKRDFLTEKIVRRGRELLRKDLERQQREKEDAMNLDVEPKENDRRPADEEVSGADQGSGTVDDGGSQPAPESDGGKKEQTGASQNPEAKAGGQENSEGAEKHGDEREKRQQQSEEEERSKQEESKTEEPETEEQQESYPQSYSNGSNPYHARVADAEDDGYESL